MSAAIPLIQQGLGLHQAGRLDEAATCYQRALQLDPRSVDAWHLLGVVAQQQGRIDEAIDKIGRAIALDPDPAAFHNNLGVAHLTRKNYPAALASFEGACQRLAVYPEAWFNRGTALRGLQRFAEAESACREALRQRPEYPEASEQLGVLLQHRGAIDEAQQCFEQAVRLHPRFGKAWGRLGTLLGSQARWSEAQRCIAKALELNPQDPEVHIQQGSIFHDQGRPDQAIGSFQRALQLDPRAVAAHNGAAAALLKLGELESARLHFRESLSMRPNDGLQVRQALATYVVIPSVEAIALERQRLEADVARLRSTPLTIDDPLSQVGATNFYHAYQGLDDRGLQSEIARLYLAACPTLDWTAPHVGERAAPRYRVGIISKFFTDHPIGKHYASLMEQWPRERWHTTVITLPGPDDAVQQGVRRSADEFVRLSPAFQTARRQIAECRLDALIYTDIGMDPWTYFLAFSRLARVQCVLPGHPVTTGIPNLDAFISSDALEVPQAQDHYSERLVRLAALPSGYCPVLPERPWKSLAELGFPADGTRYYCAQTIYKLHPEEDALWAQLLRADPTGRLILAGGRLEHWTRLLRQRLQRTLGELMDRVTILPRMPQALYMQALGQVEVVLDTPHFNGGTTTLDALAVGQPLVTLPATPLLRSRSTLGCLQALGVGETIAADRDDYVRIALRLAHDRGWRDALSTRIKAGHAALFAPSAFPRELAACLETMLEERSAG